ncbi:MAG: T9SS type A sorting domain-containing protein [Cyclobacteriaceae bacterium]|nr:T9SS type A sorting domain-containing protein [Cyclobacteriaceae bacterium]
MKSRFPNLLLLAFLLASALTLNTTFGQTGPGGVGNSGGTSGQPRNILWLRADAGVTQSGTVDAWADQSGNVQNASGAGATRPSYVASNANFNNLPSINFAATGTNKHLVIADNDLLDNTTGFTLFTVFRTNLTASDYGLISKRTSAGVDQSYMMWVSGGQLASRAASNSISGGTINNTTTYVGSTVFNGSTSTVSNFINGASASSGAAPTSIPNNASNLFIGTFNVGGETRNLDGQISEVLVYTSTLNAAQRLIVENYLASKYNLTITGDVFSGDASGFDFEVVGIGRSSGVTHTEANSAGLVLSTYNGTLDNDGEFLLAGRAAGNNSVVNCACTGYPGTIQQRWGRTWFIDKTTAGALDASIAFDFSDGVGGLFPQVKNDYELLYSSDGGTTFSIVTIPSADKSINGDKMVFRVPNASLLDGIYTLGTTNSTQSPVNGLANKTWYSYQSGNANDPLVWTLDGGGTPLYVNPSAQVPGASDNVVISSGKTITVTADNFTINNLEVYGTLDLGQFSGHATSSIAGTGRIRFAGSVSNLDNFPSGVTTAFANATTGGTVEIYGSSTFSLNQTRLFNDLIINKTGGVVSLNANYTMNGDFTMNAGEFRFGTTSSTLIVYGNNLINSGTTLSVANANVRHQYDVYGNFTNNSGTVQFTNRVAANYTAEATDGIVDFNLLNDTQNQSITCNGVTRFYRIEIDKGTDDTYLATFTANNSANFLLFGFSNNDDPATAQLASSNNSFALLRGTAEITSNVILPVLSNGGNYNISAGAMLWVNGGTVQKNNGNSTVPYGKLKVTAGLFESRVSSGITTRDNGTIIIEGGTVNTNQIRTSVLGASNIGGYVQTGGSVTVDGGGPGGTSLDYYVFSLTYSGNVFQMSGGTLTVKGSRTGTGGTRGAIFINSDPANVSVTGGSIIAEISNGNPYVITSRIPFWNLILRNTFDTTLRDIDLLGGTSGPSGGGASEITLTAQNLVVRGGLTIEAFARFDHNGRNINIAGNLTINANADLIFDQVLANGRRNTTTFDGTDNATLSFLNRIDGNGEQRFWNFVINKPSDKTVSLASGKTDLTGSNNNLLRIDGAAFKLLSGTLDQGFHSVRMFCDTVLNYQTVGVFNGAATGSGTVANDRNDMIKFRDDNTPTTLITTSNAVFGVVRLNSGDDPLRLSSNLRIQFLQYLYGKINLGTYRLTIDRMVGALTGAALPPNDDQADSLGLQLRRFSVEDMFSTSGNSSDGGLSIYVPAGTANGTRFVFPIGLGTTANDGANTPGTDKYTPATVVVSNVVDDGYIIINPVNEVLQTTNLSGGADILNYHWRVRHVGFATLPTVRYQFTYNVSDVGGSEAAYVPGKVLDVNPFTRSSEAGFVNTAVGKKIIHFDGTGTGFTLEQANYTAGAATRFTGAPEIYYTKRGGDGFTLKWNNPANWTLATDGSLPPHNSSQPDATDFPQAGDIAIVGFVPFNDPVVARRGQPHGIAIDGITANIAELRFTQLTDASNNPTARVYAYNFQFRPTVVLNNPGTQGQLINASVNGEGMFWIRSDGGNLSDPNFAGVDLGSFNLQDSSYVVYENTINGATYVNLPSTFPNLMMATNGWGSVNNSATISKDITVNGDLEILGDANLVLSTGATGNITVNRNLRFFRSNANGNDSGDGGELRFGNTGTARTVTVGGNLILGNGNFGAGSVIRIVNPDGTPITHTINLYGSFIQNTGGNNTDVVPNGNGFKAGNNSANDRINLNLLGSTSMTLTNTAGDVPQFYSITVSKGSSTATTASFNSNFTIDGPTNAATKSLILSNGLFVINASAANVVLSSGGGNFSIPASAGLQVTSGTVSLTGSDTGLLLDGLLRVNGGTVSIDDAVGNGNNFIEYSASGSAIIEVSAGTLTVGSQIRRGLTSTAGILKYRQTGGSVVVGLRAAPTTSRGVFEVVNAGSEFVHTNATLTIVRGINSTTIPSVQISPATPVVLTNTSNIVIGSANTPAGVNSQNIGITSNSRLGNLTIDNTSGNNPTAFIYSSPLSIDRTFTIATGAKFNSLGLLLTLRGDMVVNGTFIPNANTTTFFPTAATQSISGTGTISFYNFRKAGNANTIRLLNSIEVTNDLSIEQGIIADNGNTITLRGNAYFGFSPNVTGSHTSVAGGNGIVFAGLTQQQLFARRTDGAASLGTITIDNPNGVIIPDLADKFTINTELRLSRGVLDIGGSLLTLSNTATIEEVNTFSFNNMVQTNSSFTDNGMTKIFPIGTTADFIFPIGQAFYTPVVFDFADLGAGSGSGTTLARITVRPANERQPIVQEDTEIAPCNSQIDDLSNVLQYHWIIKATNTSGLESNVTLQYDQSLVALANGLTEADYIGARVRTSDNTVFKFPDLSSVDETTNIINFSLNNVTNSEISGEYFAGVDCAIPNNILTYTTKGTGLTGNVTDPTMYVGNPSPLTLSGAAIVVSPTDVLTFPSTTDNVILYQMTINGTVDIKSGSIGHRFGTVTGTGTLSFEVNSPDVSAVVPAGFYNSFFDCAGGGLQFAGNASYEILGGISSLRRLSLIGSGTRALGNNDIVICEDLTTNGPTFTNSNNRNVEIQRDLLVTAGSFLTGSGVIEVDRDLVVAGGTFNGENDGSKIVGNDLVVSSGTFTAGSGGTLTLLGDLTYSGGTFSGGTSTHKTIFQGTVAQATSGNFSLNKLEIDNSLGLTLGGNVTINSELLLTNGNITPGATSFLIGSAAIATPSEGRANSFVNGKLFKALGAGGAPTAANTFTFPIGSGSRWRTGSVSVASGTAATWDMQYFIGNADTNEAIVTNMTPVSPIVRLSKGEYWKVSDGSVSATGRTATVGLSWGIESDVNASSVERQDLRVLQWVASPTSQWQNRGGANFSSGNTQSRGTFNATSTISFSEQIVTLGSVDASNALPVTLTYFAGRIDGSIGILEWETASELNNDYFEIQHSLDGLEFTPVGRVNGKGTINQKSSYIFEDRNLTKGINYYRLRQSDFDGKVWYSDLISLDYDGSTPLIAFLYPNPTTTENVNIELVNATSQDVRVRIFDMTGKVLVNSQINSESLESVISLKSSELKSGIYIVEVVQGLQRVTKRLVITN